MPHRVLCIEADTPNRELMRRLLEGGGLAVDDSASGLEGLARARAARPDLLLFATRLPDVAGLELAARLKSEPALAGVPLVAVSRDPAEHDVAVAAGCDGFIVEPLDPGHFADEVKAYLAGKRDRTTPEGARAWLQELDRRRAAFMHDLAHELSTPLTPLAGYLKILQSDRLGPLSPQQRKVVDSMGSAVAKLTRIIDNLADFASLRAGSAVITRSAVDVDVLVAEVMGEIRALARDARLHVEVRGAGGAPVLADARKLKQAIGNVVSNALKFSPHGGEVLVDVTRDATTLRVSVYDQGPGLSPAQRERVFEPFQHADRDGDAHAPGSGLGLPVARRIAEAHGGRIVVESPPHSQPSIGAHHYTGAKFVIEIPAPAVAPPAQASG
jgi:signal transduction histidine kinase